MNSFIQMTKRISILLIFAASTMLVGCNAADLAGPEAPQTESGCGNECSEGRNL